jgi:hypothetical protein
VLRHGSGIRARRDRNGDAASLSLGKVDAVDAGAVLGNDLQALCSSQHARIKWFGPTQYDGIHTAGREPLDQARFGNGIGHEFDSPACVPQNPLCFGQEVLRSDENGEGLHLSQIIRASDAASLGALIIAIK